MVLSIGSKLPGTRHEQWITEDLPVEAGDTRSVGKHGPVKGGERRRSSSSPSQDRQDSFSKRGELVQEVRLQGASIQSVSFERPDAEREPESCGEL